MRRRGKKDILVKDFVDDKTKLAMAKASVGNGGDDYQTPKSRISSKELVSYLHEAHTVLEVQKRFDYATLRSAYLAIHRLIRKLEVQGLGHGLYAAVGAGVNSFNVGDLSERELQERGLAAYQNKIKAEKSVVLRKQVKIKSVAGRQAAIVEFCATPQTSMEIAQHLNYTSPESAQQMLAGLVNSGRLQIVGKAKGGRFLYQSPPEIMQPATEMPNIEQAVPVIEEAEAPQFNPFASEDLQQLAMRYIWEMNNAETFTAIGPIKAFIEWANKQEGK